MKELQLKDLTVEQKLGMVIHGKFTMDDNWEGFNDNLNYTIELIKNHSLGAVWVSPTFKETQRIMNAIKEAADYPILIFTDAENGIGDYKIGRHNAIGTTGSEDLAYTFGKVTGVTARKMGYNVVCDPVLDMPKGDAPTGGNIRSLGNDPQKVASLAAAISKGMHDGGVLSVAKHYPSANCKFHIDTHMAPNWSDQTKEDLLAFNLKPYLSLMKENHIDGIMSTHDSLPNIDPKYPASLSKKVIDIIREQGYNGFIVTDALPMMGIVAQFGMDTPPGLAIAAGNDIALTWTTAKEAYQRMVKAYEDGMFTHERLDQAVQRVLDAQHKVLMLSKDAEITDEDIISFKKIGTDSIYAKTDDGVSTSISKEGRHLFIMTVKNEAEINSEGKITVDTFSNDWYKPLRIEEKLLKLFKNSEVVAIPQFPNALQNSDILKKAQEFDDVVFINFADSAAYAGSDHITQRLAALINALIFSNRVSTVVHYGNPYVLEDLEHVERIIIGGVATESTLAALDVLAGDYPAKGVPTYNVDLK